MVQINTTKIKYNELAMPFMCYDIAFKAVFLGEENLLAKMISDITGIDYTVLENNIILEVNELPIITKDEKAKRCDFILKIGKNNILNLELNGSYYPGLLVKNLSYLCQIFSTATKRSEEYNDNLLATQINLNCYNENTDKSITKYLLQEVDSGQIYCKNITIFAVNVVKCHELYYTLSKERNNIPSYIKWGAFLYNRNFENIPKIVKGIMTNKERDKIMDKINKLCNDDKFMSELEAREWAEWEERSKLTYARNTGLTEGKNEGKIEGKNETTKELILSMIENNLSLDMIAKITNKTIEEIKELIN